MNPAELIELGFKLEVHNNDEQKGSGNIGTPKHDWAVGCVAIVLVVGFLIMTEVKDQASTIEGGKIYAVNATETTMGALDDIPGWLPIIVVAMIGAALLGLVAYFRGR